MSSQRGEIDVLHVDDDPDFGAVVAEWLERESESLTVSTARSAEEGLAAIESSPPDCVVSDYDMPAKTGIEFLEDVRDCDPDLPFILYTGKGSEEVASRAISAGVTDYLQKEVGTDQYAILANRIENAVDQYVAERAVEQNRERLRLVLDSLPHSVFVVDENMNYLLSNEVHAAVHGLTVDEIEGSNARELLTEEEFQAFKSDARDVVDRQTATFFPEVRITSPDGEPRLYDSRLVPFDLVGVEAETVLCVGVDVTERRRQQRRLERQNEWLETFVTVAARELSEPVATAREGLTAIAAAADDDEVARVADAHDRIAHLADGMATLADRKTTVNDPQPVALSEAVDEAWERVDAADVALVDETAGSVVADPVGLGRLLTDLFENSVQHAAVEDGAVTVTIGDLADGFFVEDDGAGIPDVDRDRVVEIGFRTGEDVAGLELTAASLLAAAHGWDVSLSEGEDDGGARFEVHGVEFA